MVELETSGAETACEKTGGQEPLRRWRMGRGQVVLKPVTLKHPTGAKNTPEQYQEQQRDVKGLLVYQGL